MKKLYNKIIRKLELIAVDFILRNGRDRKYTENKEQRALNALWASREWREEVLNIFGWSLIAKNIEEGEESFSNIHGAIDSIKESANKLGYLLDSVGGRL